MKCGCAENSINQSRGGIPWCVVHDCGETVETPNLSGRRARCTYYGMAVKDGMCNGNSCRVCKVGENCKCERDSSLDLWFFEIKPEKEFDVFYCACQGAD